MADGRLRQKLTNREFFYAPGVFDMMSTLLANRAGFDCVYASGYWLTASYLGVPDAGLATYTDMLSRVSRVAELSAAPVIADADTGFGGLLNIRETVRGYERAGVAGIQLEDQAFPKKCGHTPNRRVVSTERMLDRLRVALDARTDDNMLIIGRTDARTGEGFDAAMERAHRMAELGVDLVFVEALESEAEMREACRTVAAPLIANMATGGSTPIRSPSQLAEMGYASAIYPAMGALSASQAIATAFDALKRDDVGASAGAAVPMFDFDEMCRLLGFEDVWAFEAQWAEAIDRDSG